MNFDTKYILFTGAGFTANIGAPLARGMWCYIFNHERVQAEQRIKDLMLKDFDYESVYYSIVDGDFESHEKEAISIAVSSAYEKLDLIIREWLYRHDVKFPLNFTNVTRKLIDLFAIRNKLGFFFTINQDLFIERRYRGKHLCIPGPKTKGFQFQDPNVPLEKIENAELPTIEDLEKEKNRLMSSSNFFYIKLHGSQDWISSTGNKQIVIGKGKAQQIQQEPLLLWYFELFENLLFKQDRCLLIIGYGFRDEHINKILSVSVKKHGLKIHIVSPQSVENFYKNLEEVEFGDKIWEGLSGYYQCTLLDMFYMDSISQEYEDLRKNFFGI